MVNSFILQQSITIPNIHPSKFALIDSLDTQMKDFLPIFDVLCKELH